MKLVNLTCPNCSGLLERIGDNFVCKSCGAAFAIDYDDSDVEHEKLQNEDERAKRQFEQQKELLQMKFQQMEQSRIAAEKRERSRQTKSSIGRYFRAKISALIALAVIVALFYGCYRYMIDSGIMPSMKEMVESAMEKTKDPYDISASDITDEILDNMVDAGKNKKINTRKNPVTDYVDNEWVDYYLQSVEFDSAYFLDNISQGRNRVVIIYKLTFTSDKGEKITYDGSYFDGLKLDDNGKLVTDYVPDNISRSDASWHRDSYADREQCYRENVLAFGGDLTELTYDPSGTDDVSDESGAIAESIDGSASGQ